MKTPKIRRFNFSTITLIGSLISITASAQTGTDQRNHVFKKFSSAKKEIIEIAPENKTFYCGCPYNSEKIIDLEKCGYKYRKSKTRASHVEIEHVVPADKLCGKTEEWRNGSPHCVDKNGKHFKGRKCASEYNETCIMAYNDLQNLRPAVGEINNDRSDYPFADLPSGIKGYGSCDFRIQNHKVDPPAKVHGDIARIYLHMNQAYPELKILNQSEINFFTRWSKMDPVSNEECKYEEGIFKVEKTHNEFIREHCPVK